MDILKQFANAGAADESLAGILGIDWKMLIFQIVAFIIMVWLLGKFVYPFLVKSVDDRQKKIELGAKAAEKANNSAADAEKRIAKLLNDARVEANEIVATAKVESAATLSATEEKSKKLADQITTSARDQIDKDVLAAKNALHNEMVELVTMATEKVVGKVVSNDIDNTIITDALKKDK
ncbi:ATP synthase F0 subunit B [Candidatus Saccharibacteria bacterium CG11_big_fil_rev_8_21_14_0_20_41_19]|nr:F0F1 ATP synthase subunit B [Candidatus Saccharibacteria bacterium]OIP85828.1 MAG: ATP synthase F0 subunit B [Candidatus Saccharibacteria bacterium CG2_30_41_52]PIQ70945.1 MAG: ATP synthase F0 subunit B [Candidatus Saccharibacteria bacterium CG11_big_fil_rev_8_21_14_0_20_41_19]PIZ60747.1 MAG: ATP synthase F0 subunit B [Candidatus Saccharibacteria bacterium CG_4_10_14_0_2_um_filter_41_11]PJC29402.1 MAG: ATP synthase F0 subunit B [Candidatus Saccharibacteria bacterium CG_4_9_14_0_2_um_filter_4